MSAETSSSPREKTPFAVCGVALLLAVLALLIIWLKSMAHSMSHDEHQFVAPAVLLAKEGLLPYRDFPMFHMPTVVLIYSFFAKFTDYYILSAMGFGAVCGWMVVCLVGLRTYAWLEEFRPWPRLLIATGISIMLMASVVFVRTTGHAWNHDFPLLLTVLAFLAHIRAARGSRAWLWLFLSGICVGLASGSRISYLPLVAPFGLAIFFFRDTGWRQKLVLGAGFGMGVFVGLLPSLYFYLQAPEAFIFDNFKYPRLRLLDPTDNAHKTFTFSRKVRFLWKYIVQPDWAIFVGFFALAVPVFASRFRRFRSAEPEIILLTLMLPFIIQGCVSPTRTHDQHFYSLIPILILAVAYGFSRIPVATLWNRIACVLLVVLSIASVVQGWPRYKRRFAPLTPVARWNPVQIHLAGVQLASEVGPGRVLTFAPIEVLEGGLKIYPITATGPFAIRTAHLVEDAGLRKRLHLITTAEIPEFLAKNPPGSIVLGAEPPDEEKPFREFAETHQYRLIRMDVEGKGGKEKRLYVKPE